MPPIVSILLPVYNAQATLRPALTSLLRQRLVHWECVAVDDGSSDDSVQILRDFARADPRLRPVERSHAGIVASLNAGLDLCEGRFVARMDADDLMHRDRLAEQVARLDAEHGLAGCGCHVRLFPRGALLDGRRAYERWLNSLRTASDVARDAFVECPLAHPTWMLHKRVLLAHRYRDRGWPEDYDLLLRLLASGERLGVVPRRLLFWRDSSGRLSRTCPMYALDRFVACKAHHLARSYLRGVRDYVLWGYGDTGRVLARSLSSEGLRVSHIIEVHPGRIGQRILGAPVLSPDALASLAFERMVVSVAGQPARNQVRAKARELGLVEGKHFVCAA